MHRETVGESLVEIAAMLVSAAVSWTASWWVIKRDEKKLDETMLARAYAPATLACSVFVFQQIAVLVHFIRTRRSFRGFLLGVLWTVVAFVPSIAVELIFDVFLPG
ncbi:MAG TPA: hypothetical protein VGH28_12945 [Polyangiaceae bacterium]|jgi:hypothetical protein